MLVDSPQSSSLGDIAARVEAGERLSYEDGVRLYRSPDIHGLGRLADIVRRRTNGRVAYYNVNRHINYTNFCVLRCKFCSFYRPYEKAPGTTSRGRSILPTLPLLGDHAGTTGPREADAYELSVDEIVARAAEAYAVGATEVHIVGGLHPKLPFEYYLEMCAAIRAACPRMHIKA